MHLYIKTQKCINHPSLIKAFIFSSSSISSSSSLTLLRYRAVLGQSMYIIFPTALIDPYEK